MKNHYTTRPVIRAAVFCLLALAVPTALFVLHAADKPASAADKPAQTPAPPQLARDMMGTWVLVGKPGKVGEPPAAGGRLKFRTGRHWTMTQANPDTGLTVMHDGGTYTLDGDKYVETIEYANQSTANDIGKSFMFTVKVEGDTMTQTGIGNPYTEVWKRLK
jgi:hypothetical protein